MDETNWKNKLVTAAMTICIAASSWFLSQAWEKISKLEDRVQKIELNAATVAGNRFSSNDWGMAKNVLDAERTALDRRIIRLEETLPVIKDSLLEIKQQLKDK